ncbi:helix-turn-helix domain-containing protein [Saprospiraceae bacterium]|nr:helix-turn-helix domain-containing protein [Saprospiraceae bacterium]
MYEETQSVTKTSLRCSIARSTLYRWIKRYNESGKAGLSDKSKRPLKLVNQKMDDELEQLILRIRKKHKWEAQRISNYLKRTKRIDISAMPIWRVLNKHEVPKITKHRKKSDYQRYSRPIPGDRVQMDVSKIRPGAYQYTAIDDSTRLKIIRIYPRKTAKNTIDFLGEVLDDFGFPIQRIQTDWGTEFFNYDFQYELHEHFIKFRPIKPRSPHLNGKVERTQKTDKEEFWSCIDLKDKDLDLNKLTKDW